MEPDRTLRVLFIHGLMSGPRGHKARYLEQRFLLEAPAMQTGDFLACLAVQREALARHRPQVVLGSSFGCAVLLKLLQEGAWTGPSVFLAQAARRLDADARLPAERSVLLIHGLRDEVVPVQESRDLAATSPLATLWEVDDEHRLLGLTRGERLAEVVRGAASGDLRAARAACTY